MSSSIPLSQAIAMTTLYRQTKPNIIAAGFDPGILSICETFDVADIQNLLSTQGCASIRAYYGMSTDFNIHAVLVAVDSSGADILPVTDYPAGSNGNNPDIVDEAQRCPPYCGPSSALNP